MSRVRALLGVTLVLAFPAPALACVPPPPLQRLAGESDADLAVRARTFGEAEADENRRRQQSGWFDRADRVSLARITASGEISRLLGMGSLRARRVEALRLGTFKGEAAPGTVAMEDVGITSCGVYGGGTARSGKPGAYIVTFEGVQPEGTGNVGVPLSELRDPRIIQAFSEVAKPALEGAKP
ncbi:hypothetical protein GGQ97_002215 [Sphingomonas kaistensis]|uniref:DUF4410 domain-containing protein n=1 Tax=Sphingomonas kaistensis TaxID=298708 RepID=A0A7X5Y8C7_9SPHN|nr:hypothetical protein [Sphingomonas kaistensis]NJC06422.1 hypothetical protein [Sphingomonas kaistensis]